MNPVAVFIGLLLLAGSVFFVVNPFRSPVGKKKTGARADHLINTPEKQRQAVLLALRDLDFDFRANKLAEEDYQALRSGLLNQAAQLIQETEQVKEDSIEAMILSRRKARSSGDNPNLEKSNGQAGALCQHCHTPLKEGARFCSKCGKPVGQAACPKCMQPLNPGDRFCPVCGTLYGSGGST